MAKESLQAVTDIKFVPPLAPGENGQIVVGSKEIEFETDGEGK